jgi:hypothetical protein
MGKCGNPVKADETYCVAHQKVKCVICGKQATHTCPQTSTLVCGTPLCNKRTCRTRHDQQAHAKPKRYNISRASIMKKARLG